MKAFLAGCVFTAPLVAQLAIPGDHVTISIICSVVWLIGWGAVGFVFLIASGDR